MLKSALITLFTAATAVLAMPALAYAEETKASQVRRAPAAPAKSGHVEAGGVNYYYEIHGEGEPLLLLHGGLGSIDMFAPILPVLAEAPQVIAVDLQGHGRTTLGDRPISLVGHGRRHGRDARRSSATSKVDVLGYSFGGGVAFRLAVQHPETVRRLVLVSAGLRAGRLLSGDAAAAGAGRRRRWPT